MTGTKSLEQTYTCHLSRKSHYVIQLTTENNAKVQLLSKWHLWYSICCFSNRFRYARNSSSLYHCSVYDVLTVHQGVIEPKRLAEAALRYTPKYYHLLPLPVNVHSCCGLSAVDEAVLTQYYRTFTALI